MLNPSTKFSLKRSALGAVALILVELVCPLSCPADSINSSSNSSSVKPPDLGESGTLFSYYEGYFVQNGPDYTTPLDAPEFSLLGQTSGSFLFTPNTMYGWNGTPVVSVLSTYADPGTGVLALNDPTNRVLSFTLTGSSESHANVPEPRAIYLTGAGLLLLGMFWSAGRVRRSSAR